MARNLLIVEAPGKVKKLQELLGPGWMVRASGGHIRELAKDGESQLGFAMEGGRITCRFVERGERSRENIKNLAAAAAKADRIYLGTDSDREGATIAWHITEVLGITNPLRMVYTEITKKALEEAANAPVPLNMHLVNAGLARACLDKLVGFKGSPLAWKLGIGAASVGRVQTATLAIVCDREREIRAFTPEVYYTITVQYAEGFRAHYLGEKDQGEDAPVEERDDAAERREGEEGNSAKVKLAAEAERIVALGKAHPHSVKSVEGKTSYKPPPPPFTTSTLQQTAGARLRFSPERTMELAQKLYEKGHITYHRTDAVFLSEQFRTAAREWLEAKDPTNVPTVTTRHRTTKGAQEAHEAIRPTDIHRSSGALKGELSADEFELYLLIWLRSLASQCKPAELRKSKVITVSGPISWIARGQIVTFPGYGRYWKDLSDDTELPPLTPSQPLVAETVDAERRETQPPPRYTEARLVKAMERSGIGRPSTYSPTLKILKERGYIELQSAKVVPTSLGMTLDEFIERAIPGLRKKELTAEMEGKLDAIAEGREAWEAYVIGWNGSYFAPALREAYQLVSQLPPQPAGAAPPRIHKREAPRSSVTCTTCGEAMVKLVPRTAKLDKPYFLKCERCNGVLFYNKERDEWVPPRATAHGTRGG